ncbi:hypothetical protein B0H65DRAFT_570286 [Neurospora tetraspora]|uniref:Uncharacterized protein n=1 Tax=Neurospora tetraspora TaxID=94610 RepID=A0AAE0MTT3_9PEZI|nr:hypothetical protein B0H65DRAFT_570286 [Neurospora tetraspora]
MMVLVSRQYQAPGLRFSELQALMKNGWKPWMGPLSAATPIHPIISNRNSIVNFKTLMRACVNLNAQTHKREANGHPTRRGIEQQSIAGKASSFEGSRPVASQLTFVPCIKNTKDTRTLTPPCIRAQDISNKQKQRTLNTPTPTTTQGTKGNSNPQSPFQYRSSLAKKVLSEVPHSETCAIGRRRHRPAADPPTSRQVPRQSQAKIFYFHFQHLAFWRLGTGPTEKSQRN